MIITPTTPISQLHDAGIVPDWMYRDCDLHGMDEAENILCEWDWEDGWDLGDGYTKNQLDVLAQVRKFMREGQCLIRVSPIQLMRIITLVRSDYTLSSKNGQTILLSKN